MPTRQVLFITISDRRFFPGTLATVNSILRYHPAARVTVVSSGMYNEPLTEPQMRMLQSPQVTVRLHGEFAKPGRVLGTWQLKAYAAADLLEACNVLVGIDSDAMVCGPVSDIVDACVQDGRFRGGQDGNMVTYDASYAPYGFPVPCHSSTYMSTAHYYCARTEENASILNEWAAKCDKAVFGPQPEKVYPGHGDQGVLNAVIYARAPDGDKVELLENRTLSQHWVYVQDVIQFAAGRFLNVSMNNAVMRGFHCGGHPKWWEKEHSEKLKAGQGQRWTYAYFLYNVWFGVLSDLQSDPTQWLPEESRHLKSDLAEYREMLAALNGDTPRFQENGR